MRPLSHQLVALLSLSLLCSTAVAKEETTLGARGKTAIGLPLLPSPDYMRGISIWCVRHTTMLGLEMNVSTASTAQVKRNERNEDRSSIGINAALTIKRLRPLRWSLAPFLYQTLYGTVARSKSPAQYSMQWSAGVGLGLGALWFPGQRVSLSLRQGLALELRNSKEESNFFDSPKAKLEEFSQFSIVVPSMRLVALFHF